MDAESADGGPATTVDDYLAGLDPADRAVIGRIYRALVGSARHHRS
ncbi:hypothetical protein IA539_06620 [Gordonia sp. zg691]|uniref:Uncharacterized protein n=1 Tax=Gordonia jinghuaiqii TaxID=2758710 RepID=A0A7D7QYX3_9ACTN|nr:hypothetical protein [Gordonia jinghuaiqii]MBD0860883.1 hypothetical protein [Gordonia jinghuaiqii]QMT00651.1 hypothetical protein H1R19_17390 [Gordonia jinghuaiqii]